MVFVIIFLVTIHGWSPSQVYETRMALNDHVYETDVRVFWMMEGCLWPAIYPIEKVM